VQDDNPDVFVKDPGAHAKQEVRDESTPLDEKPRAHKLHDVWPGELEKLPLPHALQTEAPVRFIKVPGEQLTQAVAADAKAKVPVPQGEHAVLPVPPVKVPGEQELQELRPVKFMKVPIPQEVQLERPVTDATEPVGQSIQKLAPMKVDTSRLDTKNKPQRLYCSQKSQKHTVRKR